MRRIFITIVSLGLYGGATLYAGNQIARSVIASGGAGAVATHHSIRSTLGQPIVGSASSAHHLVQSGFWPTVTAAPCSPCDTNCDGSINGFDIDPFVGLLTGGGSPCAPCAGDVNYDGSVNGFDVDGFVAALSGGGC